MRVPLTWLAEYCDPRLPTAELAERLTITGTKVEAIHRHGAPALDGFTVGLVESVQAHPDADRLRVCTVDLGDARPEGPAQIVCGAPNVQAGALVAVALPGARMPDGGKLKASKLRGVRSEGMILAEDELQIGVEHNGIMVLGNAPGRGIADASGQQQGGGEPAGAQHREAHLAGASARAGRPFGELVEIGCDVLELEVTPNRPDCLGIYGVAREVHAATGAPLAAPPWSDDPGSAGPLAGVEVRVECPDLCPRFTARQFSDVRVGPSPLWLKARLMAAGQRPINNVVDITNYVMLLTGQPLHAFDFDRIEGGKLIVRRAHAGEQVRTLDGQSRYPGGDVVLVCDAAGPTAIAGLMGGERSEVHAGTANVLLEVASWNGPNIHRSSLALGLRSEASARFEKGLAPQSCDHAQAIASRLLIELCGARLQPGTIDCVADAALQAPRSIQLRAAQVKRVLGIAIPRRRQEAILRALDFGVQAIGGDDGDDDGAAGDLLVEVPALRAGDVSREADLIEEIARIAGLESLPATLPARKGAHGQLSRSQLLARRLTEMLAAQGLYEVKGWTFTSREALAQLSPGGARPDAPGAVALRNPLSAEQALLRTSLLCSLRAAAAYNLAREASDFGIFEIGNVFELAGAPPPPSGGRAEGERKALNGAAELVRERRMLALMLVGAGAAHGWRSGRQSARMSADFHSAKALLDAIGALLGVELACSPPEEPAPFLHPGRSAAVRIAAQGSPGAGAQARPAGPAIGWIGELHPQVAGGSLAGAPALELELAPLLAAAAGRTIRFSPIPEQPALLRDLSLQMPAALAAEQVRAVIRAAGESSGLIEDVQVIDVYAGDQLAPGERSLTLRISFRAPDRTLSEQDVAPPLAAIQAALAQIGARQRSQEAVGG